MSATLHAQTQDYLDDFVGCWQATTDSQFDKDRFQLFVNELLFRKDSWYAAIDYIKSKNMRGDYLWEWINTLDLGMSSRLRAHIENETKRGDIP